MSLPTPALSYYHVGVCMVKIDLTIIRVRRYRGPGPESRWYLELNRSSSTVSGIPLLFPISFCHDNSSDAHVVVTDVPPVPRCNPKARWYRKRSPKFNGLTSADLIVVRLFAQLNFCQLAHCLFSLSLLFIVVHRSFPQGGKGCLIGFTWRLFK